MKSLIIGCVRDIMVQEHGVMCSRFPCPLTFREARRADVWNRAMSLSLIDINALCLSRIQISRSHIRPYDRHADLMSINVWCATAPGTLYQLRGCYRVRDRSVKSLDMSAVSEAT